MRKYNSLIKISSEVRRHLIPHFTQELPGSKFYFNSPEELLDKAISQFAEVFSSAKPDSDGRIRLCLSFPEEIGISNVVSVDELTCEEKNAIEIVDRQGRKVRSVKTDRVIPTHKCQIILSEDWQLITMFPGEMAPPLPETLDEYNEFWDTHVFIETKE